MLLFHNTKHCNDIFTYDESSKVITDFFSNNKYLRHYLSISVRFVVINNAYHLIFRKEN